MSVLRVQCYAKINLGLRVLGLRPDGYHELRTVFQTISLSDTLEVWRERGPAGAHLECDLPHLSGPENLAARAAELMLEELGLRARVRLRLRKSIPVGAGLGGGSSDAAAALRALLRLARRRLPPERLLALAARLGSDVPFFLLGGTALGIGRGTEVYALPEPPSEPLLVVYPGMSLNTAQAYAALRDRRPQPSLTDAAEPDRIFSFCATIVPLCGVRRGDRLAAKPAVVLANDFEPVVFSTYPQLARLKSFLIRRGASAALLSGSGSAVVGFFGNRRQAEQAGKALQSRHPDWRAWVARTVPRAVFERQWNRIG